jgi:exoribonuclease-2
VAQYAWSSSPLRRYVDLVNQRQIIALTRGEAAPYRKGGDELVIAMRDFELAYDAYAEFQRGMERYWCLRWILQEAAQRTRASVVRESLVRIDRIPLYLRTPSLPELPVGTPVEVELSAIDLLTLECDCRFVGKVAETP